MCICFRGLVSVSITIVSFKYIKMGTAIICWHMITGELIWWWYECLKSQWNCCLNLLIYVFFPPFSRAVNNDLIDTYQLKSLNGLVENNMEDLAIIQQGGKKLSKKKRFYLLSKHLYENLKEMNSTALVKEVLQKHKKERETFFWQKPYDRVIQCTGFRFNFSIFDR